jgi:predicted transcriptional regulator
MTRTVLTIKVESDEAFHDRVQADLEALDAGVELDETHELSLPDERALARVLSASNLELVRTIAAESPESIRETARLVDRDVKDVHENLTELDQYGLIEFERDGRAKRPVVWYDDIEISVPVRLSSDESIAPA